jgi:hypothetical protein
MISSPPLSIPKPWQRLYLFLRVALYMSLFFMTIFILLRVLFPVLTQTFDFRSPDSSKNTILNPRSTESHPRTNGKIEKAGILIADITVVGDFSQVTTTATLTKNSLLPPTLLFSLRRSYQSFLYPTGTAITDFPATLNYRVGDIYYALLNDTLFPYVSAQAFLSRFPETQALLADNTLFQQYPVSDDWLGFRVGSLLGNAMGVFIVVSDTEIRPVGSADIFLALGYSFDDVITVSEEELGIYTHGRIILLGAAHPDGTLLFDQDNGTYFLIEHGTKRPFEAGLYRDYLLTNLHPILVSSQASEQSIACTLLPHFFGKTLSCTAPLTTLRPGFGNDFRIEIQSGETAIDMNTLSTSFETTKNKQNVLTFLSQIKQRLLARFLP